MSIKVAHLALLLNLWVKHSAYKLVDSIQQLNFSFLQNNLEKQISISSCGLNCDLFSVLSVVYYVTWMLKCLIFKLSIAVSLGKHVVCVVWEAFPG